MRRWGAAGAAPPQEAAAALPAPAPPKAEPPPRPAPVPSGPPVLLRDHRILTFAPQMLCLALHHAGRNQMRLPVGEISAAELLPDSQAVRFRFGPQGRAGEVVVGTPALAAMLIAYCIGAGIPVPTQAAKTLEVTDLGVKLELRIVLTAPPFFKPRNAAEW
ncbi:hypothetical protein NON00_02955 [Roseomonas sp. GC11]|uniref:hypothetical protein n=1 Tax=Roseomonas sp. GC11 TaxID=2950546 RepID=UPI00210CA54C|nr:hypothetical protein [Roseomonas sp. GC11]MCQ4158885.1 hypothetical protein [Roseomonas sp. GC11]